MRPRGPPFTLTAVARRRRAQRRPRRTRHTVFETLREGTGELVQSVANEVVPGVVDALDIDEVVQRLDIQAIVDRVDIESLIDRVDVSRLIERIDLDVVLAKVDIDALLARVDVNALLEQTEFAAAITRSGAALIGRTLVVVRRQGMGLDSLVERWTNRLLRRREPQPSSTPFVVSGPELRVR
jgi:predicted thioredoxin/glutaredoxin